MLIYNVANVLYTEVDTRMTTSSSVLLLSGYHPGISIWVGLAIHRKVILLRIPTWPILLRIPTWPAAALTRAEEEEQTLVRCMMIFMMRVAVLLYLLNTFVFYCFLEYIYLSTFKKLALFFFTLGKSNSFWAFGHHF